MNANIIQTLAKREEHRELLERQLAKLKADKTLCMKIYDNEPDNNARTIHAPFSDRIRTLLVEEWEQKLATVTRECRELATQVKDLYYE